MKKFIDCNMYCIHLYIMKSFQVELFHIFITFYHFPPKNIFLENFIFNYFNITQQVALLSSFYITIQPYIHIFLVSWSNILYDCKYVLLDCTCFTNISLTATFFCYLAEDIYLPTDQFDKGKKQEYPIQRKPPTCH